QVAVGGAERSPLHNSSSGLLMIKYRGLTSTSREPGSTRGKPISTKAGVQGGACGFWIASSPTTTKNSAATWDDRDSFLPSAGAEARRRIAGAPGKVA